MSSGRDAGAAPAARLRVLAHATMLALQCAAHALFAGPWGQIRGFPLDDAWIHQTIARTFATSGTLGYAPGQHGAAATSCLWPMVLGANFRFFHFDPVPFTLAANLALALGAGQCLLYLTLRAGRPRRAAEIAPLVGACALACFGGNFVWFTFSGMEASLLVFLSLAAIACSARPTPRRLACAGALAGLLGVTRPEAALLGAVLLARALLAKVPLRRAAWLAGPWGAAIAIYGLVNVANTGHLVPATFGGRRWLWLESNAGLPHARMAWELVLDWLTRLRNYTLGTSATPLLWISLGLGARGLVWIARARDGLLRVLVAWSALHVAIYMVLLPTFGHGGRYQPLTPLVYLLLVGLGSVELVGDAIRRFAPPRSEAAKNVASAAPAAAVCAWAALVSVGVRDWRSDHADAVAHIEGTEVAAGRFLRDLPPGAKVASYDVGGTSFFAERPVLDIGGLADPRAGALLREGRIWEYLQGNAIDYLVLPHGDRDDLPEGVNFGHKLVLFDNPALALERVADFATPRDRWEKGEFATQNAAPRQGVYRVRYTGRMGPAPSRPPADAPPMVDAAGLVDARVRARVDHGLRVLAGAGVFVDLAVTREAAEATTAATAWTVRLGPWGARVAPPRVTAIEARDVEARVTEWILPYVPGGEIGAAARASLHVVVLLVREHADPTFFPSLPAFQPPGQPPPGPTTASTLPWGGPLALLVALAALALARPRRA